MSLGPGEILGIIAIVVLLFGAKKLPELARGAGQGLRIFKTELKGDSADETTAPEVLESTENKPEQA
jgi:sec-independent protein translocase protein TatA